MLDCEDIENYSRLGFAIVRQVLSPKEILHLREFIPKHVELNGFMGQVSPDQVIKYPELFMLPFKEKIVHALKKALGEKIYYYPDFHVQYNQFGQWHFDCLTEIPAPYLTAPDYNHVKCGIFLQDNTIEWGGGISLLPGCHKFPLKTGLTRLDFYIKRLRDYLSTFKKEIADIRAGDFIFFDSRLPHTSTTPSYIPDTDYSIRGRMLKVDKIPEEHYKMVFYWDASNPNTVTEFMSNSERRSREGKAFFASYLKLHYSDSFPSDLIQKANELSIDIASLEKKKCAEYESIFQDNESA